MDADEELQNINLYVMCIELMILGVASYLFADVKSG